VKLLNRFAEPLAKLQQGGFLKQDADVLRLTREGLLQVDRLVPEFFLPEHRGARYA
jgi:oxygen-independent coproporphyrinogen-3 oxidase